MEDGRFNIVLLGIERFRYIQDIEMDAGYRCAAVDIQAFDDNEPSPLSLGERAEVEREARRLGDALGLAVDWDAVSRLDDEMLVNAIAQVAYTRRSLTGRTAGLDDASIFWFSSCIPPRSREQRQRDRPTFQ